jgi:UDP-N-acetylglucosamine 2-epimerase (non-hydrolysing)
MAADRLGVPLARIGAGLRCDDRGIEAEINRIVLDELATRLYVDGDDAAERLQAEGFDHGRVVCAGSTLPDAIAGRPAGGSPLLAELGLIRGAYVLVTVHKPENVRDDARFRGIVEALSALAHRTAVVLCMHPVTAARMETTRAIRTLRTAGAIVRGAAAHPDFLALQASAGAVVTDSAGVQEETTVLGVPCFTIGRSTERALTVTHGTNVLLGEDPLEIADVPVGSLPEDLSEIPLWDGNAGRRIAADLADWSDA